MHKRTKQKFSDPLNFGDPLDPKETGKILTKKHPPISTHEARGPGYPYLARLQREAKKRGIRVH